ncbi:DUF6638 family protein [Pseudothioclava arenosa]|uniref:Uncharacterized protein n=1 Tax=Pseudothioclava arenosa TaxID=1795308 RepID=A0A2A4CRQ3_9RHOB|nr:DUF6638 family protein [Pseudothioclava arenosa]PCD77911.1 hypothetical protein CLN94_00930 [Pseudothioclava arenosa]
MKRLIEKGLMFGNLVRVDAPALVERYNRALRHLGKPQTTQTEFHIDISGYSPEVGDEFGDHLYLNPNGVNRQFILLSTEQKSAPLLNATFSMERAILRSFIEENEAQLFSLTARDAVAGELEDTVYELSSPARLFDIKTMVVVADTAGNHVAEAEKLGALVERFRTEPDAWFDDVLIADMIGLAKKTGDVTRNPVRLKATRFETQDFWSSHFGGVYVFRSLPHPAAICMGDRLALGALPIRYVFGVEQRNEIAKFLQINELVEPIVGARGFDAGAVLRQKMDFILVEAAARLGLNPGDGSRRELRRVAQDLGERLPPEFQALAALLRWKEAGGPWPRIDSRHPAYFYTLRAAEGPQKALVNQLLSELSPLDVRQLFICHKALFYRLYADWPEAKKAYVADFLEREYQIDKAGVREALFGAEPAMSEEDAGGQAAPRRVRPSRDVADLMGPWGKVLGGGR